MRTVLLVAILLLSTVLRAQNGSIADKNDYCGALKSVFLNDQRLKNDLRSFSSTPKIVIANHGFDLTCLKGEKDFELIEKEQLVRQRSFISIFSIHEMEDKIEVAFVRTKDGIALPMETVQIIKR